MLFFLLAACEVEVSGRVVDPVGIGVGGAGLDGATCTAVTEADGSFRTRCPRGLHHFVVRHPAYAASTLTIDATGLLSPQPETATLRAWPTTPGLYVQPELTPLVSTPLARTVSTTEQRFCLPAGTALPALAADPSFFDVHDSDWRLLTLDTDGCAFVLKTRDGGRYWSPTATQVEAPTTEIAPGFRHVKPELPAGRYAVVTWYDGFLVPADAKADTWEAWAFEVK